MQVQMQMHMQVDMQTGMQNDANQISKISRIFTTAAKG